MSVHYNPPSVTDGLVLHLDVTNPRSYPGTGTTWFDMSGNRNHGTLTNMNVPACYVRTYGGRALDFDGTNDYVVSIVDGTKLSAVSISFWFNARTSTAQRGMFSWSNEPQAGIVFVYISHEPSSVARIYVNGNYRQTITTPNRWAQYAVTHNGSVWEFFLDGLSVGSYVGGRQEQNFAEKIYFASGYGGTANGQGDDLRIYNRALSPQEILQNFNATRGRFGV